MKLPKIENINDFINHFGKEKMKLLVDYFEDVLIYEGKDNEFNNPLKITEINTCKDLNCDSNDIDYEYYCESTFILENLVLNAIFHLKGQNGEESKFFDEMFIFKEKTINHQKSIIKKKVRNF